MPTLDERTALRERTHVPAPPTRRSTWFWWGVLVVVLAVSFVAAIWVFGGETAALPENVTGFDYDHEVTPIHIAALESAMAFHGIDANLDPDPGEWYFHETTPIHIASLREPLPFVGRDANLDP